VTTRFIFFSGKGGVGKTSMACTYAVHHADRGERTLIVTTDPASNLADVFEQPIGHQITPIAGVPGLWAMEIDPDRATEEYIDRALAPVRTAFPPAMVQVIEEQMSGPCTAEVAAFDRFTDFLDGTTGSAAPQEFDLVIFDTAPTGHTLRLLELPAEWSQSIQAAARGSGQTCIGPAAAIQDAQQKYERALTIMRDPEHTTFIFVLHPEAIAIRETRRATVELSKLNIHTHQLIINGVIPPEAQENALFAARAAMQARYLSDIENTLPLPTRQMVLLPGEIKGLDRLRQVAARFFGGVSEWTPVYEAQRAGGRTGSVSRPSQGSQALESLLPNGHRRTIFFAGKGGVGKTVSSCLTAVWLARQGLRTLLLTTDPAAHLGDVLGIPVGDEPARVEGQTHLWVAKIDPKAAAETYKARILANARQRGRPEAAIRVMAEELESPCTEEIAAFDRFIDYASQEGWEVVVFDTAPTGHTLRLLELPIDWSKQLDVKVFASVDTEAADDVAKRRFQQVIEMMRDGDRSTFAFVMYPESTPVLEAYRAAEELRTAGIEPGLTVANFVIPPDQADNPFVRARRAMQAVHLQDIQARFPVPMIEIPLLPDEIRGMSALEAIGAQIFDPLVVGKGT
jgi:arsenite-transporting ATPase